MKNPDTKKDDGLRRKIRQGRRLFRIPENIGHCSDAGYKEAGKSFVKWCILEGCCWS